MIWHSHTVSDVLTELCVDSTAGLTDREAADRLNEYGKNCLQEQKILSFGQAFGRQLRSPDTILLLAVSGLVLVLNLYTQLLREIATPWPIPLTVAAAAIVAALLNAWRQHRASAATAALKALSTPDVCVRRNGAEQMRCADTLVPGDILLLQAGDVVPADCRLIEADRLQCDESALIGTTMPTDKYADAVFDDITPLAQRTNMLYAGTAVTCGTATAVVVATGMRSEMGHSLKRLPQARHHRTAPSHTNRLNVWWSVTVAGVSLLILLIALLSRTDRSAVLLTVAAMSAAALPTGIAALHTLLSENGIRRILTQGIRVQHSEAIDVLGQVSVVCIDHKMLPQDGEAELCRAFVGHRTADMTADAPKAPGLGQLMRLAALNTTEGDPAGNAILAGLHRMGIDPNELRLDMPRIGELPPASGRTTTVHLAGEQTLILVSGEWRSLLPLCTKGNTEELTAAATAMERDGLQVTAVTYRLTDTAPSVYTADALEQDLTCVGLLGLHFPLHTDAPRMESRVRTLLFSDESAAVAVTAAQSAGLTATPYVATGEAIASLSDEDLSGALRHYNVYCGLDTAQKQRVLALLRQQGEVVAITAADSEEAALLTAADVGIAYGNRATAVAKAAADLILTEEDPTAVFTAMETGHHLYGEKKVLLLYLIIGSALILLLGCIGLMGAYPLSVTTVWLMALYLLLLALPTPLWATLGISHIIRNLRKKR